MPCRARDGIRGHSAKASSSLPLPGHSSYRGIGRLAPAQVGVMFAVVENGGVPEATTMSDYFLGTSASGAQGGHLPKR